MLGLLEKSVVLLENVEHLGIVGDVKEVANGYARNYLLAEELAVKVGDEKGKILVKNISKKRDKVKKEIAKIEKLAKDFEGKQIKFKAKATSKGKLYASITSRDVAKKLKLEDDQVEFPPIKDAGEHKVRIYLGHNIKTNIIVFIEGVIEDKKKK